MKTERELLQLIINELNEKLDKKEKEIEEEVPIEEEKPLEQVEEIITEKEPTKVISKTEEKVEEIPSEEKKPKEEPELKITKEIEIEELPKEDVIYKLVKYGSKKYPQTKVIKKSKTYKYGRELDNEEPIHNDAVIYEPNKEEQNIKIIRKKIVLFLIILV